MEDHELARIAEGVQAARLAAGLSKEAAARKAEVSSITFKRVEDGQPVRDASLAKILAALDLSHTRTGEAHLRLTASASGSVVGADDDGPEFNFLTRVREDLTTEQMEQLMTEATPYLEMLVRDIKNRHREP